MQNPGNQVAKNKPTLEKYLATGGTSEVWLGNAPWLTSDKVAIKISKNVSNSNDDHDNKVAATQCVIEAEMMIESKLAHPNIIKYYQSLVIGTRPSIIMEAMACSLAHVLSKTPLLNDNVPNNSLIHEKHLSIALGIAQALQYMHANQFVHRDIKTDNILVDEPAENAKLCDFGWAVDLRDADRIFWQRGTPCWYAPETVTNEPTLHPERRDMWSYGQVLLQLYIHSSNINLDGIISARPYVTSRDMTQVCRIIKRGEHDPIPKDKPLSAVISWCLKKSPNERASSTQVVEELGKVKPKLT